MSEDHPIFDEYLDACLEGDAQDPEAFLAAHPGLDPEVCEKIRALHVAGGRAVEPDLPFERIGDYRLLERLDAGGMGAVYVAEQESLGRVVALKLLRPDWAGDPQAEKRFAREAKAVAQLRHRGIVTVYDAGVDGDTRYLAMEMVPGRMLSDVLAEAAMTNTPIAVDRIVRWGAGLARALDYAHGRGIVHRDIKPENIRITPDDAPMLLDFGIAVDVTGARTTVSRTFQGSPAYAAPEQIVDGEVDGRTDVYALGVTLYQALTGDVPFAAATVEGVFHRVLTEAPRAPRKFQRAVSADLETVILKAMEKRPARRYESAGGFAEDLEAILAFRPVAARPPGPVARLGKWARRRPAHAVAVGSALAFVLVLGALALLQRRAASEARASEAHDLLRKASAAVEEYRSERMASLDQEQRLGKLRSEMRNRYFSDEEVRTLRALDSDVERRNRRRGEIFHEVLSMVRRAELMLPGIPGGDATRAALFVEKYEEAKTAHDPVRQAFFRTQAELLDAEGEAVTRLAETGTLELTVEPADARAWLFTFRERREVVPGAGRRLVPVPIGPPATPPVSYGSTVLRVVRGVGPLSEGDLILRLLGHPVGETLFVRPSGGAVVRLESVDGHPVRTAADLEERVRTPGPHRFLVDGEERVGDSVVDLGLAVLRPALVAEAGGVEAEAFIDGTLQSLRLPRGLVTRRTATPLLHTPEARVVGTIRNLPVGHYLVVARAPGHEEARAYVQIAPGKSFERHLRLHPIGSTPPGFIRIPETRHGPSFLIQEREVICEEYLAFLNDPVVASTITDGARKLVPRGPLGDWLFEREAGRFITGEGWTPDTAVMGLSFHDARAYVAWRSKRDGLPYRLPKEDEWNRASGHWPFARAYVFGHAFFPKYVSSNWARAYARPEPWHRYPVDESPYGVYATSGGAMEWIDAWWGKDRDLRWLAGGAWGYADPALFRSPGGWGNKPEMVTGTYGFRLALDP